MNELLPDQSEVRFNEESEKVLIPAKGQSYGLPKRLYRTQTAEHTSSTVMKTSAEVRDRTVNELPTEGSFLFRWGEYSFIVYTPIRNRRLLSCHPLVRDLMIFTTFNVLFDERG